MTDSSNTGSPPFNVVIVGGGTAGWMTAVALSSFFAPERVAVTLVESPEVATIGVGESTIPAIRTFNEMVGIDDKMLIRETGATFKLGIEFHNFSKPGSRYTHPFGEHGVALDSLAFYQYWLRLQSEGLGGQLGDYAVCAVAAAANKFAPPSGDMRSPLSGLSHAFHLDAHKYVQLLSKLAIARGVTHITGTVDDIQLHQSGDIAAVRLASGHRIGGDLFIDCTGFKSLLIGKTLHSEFSDWRHWLPCNKAAVQASEALSPLPSSTSATAQVAGWQWRIPLQHRCGNGYVYSDVFHSDDDAVSIMQQHLPSAPVGDARIVHFKTGMRPQSWVKNCVAIGLSSGFVEPMESTSIHMIQRAVLLLLDLFPADASHCSNEARQFNQQMETLALSVRDFIVLHYHLNARKGEPFWDAMRELSLPDTLQHKIDLYRHCGRIYQAPGDLFSEHAWLAVLNGQGIKPVHTHPLSQERPLAVVNEQLTLVKNAIGAAVAGMPDHGAYIARLKSQV